MVLPIKEYQKYAFKCVYKKYVTGNQQVPENVCYYKQQLFSS